MSDGVGDDTGHGLDDTVTLRRLWDETAATIGDRPAARWLCEVAASREGDEFVEALDQPVTNRVVAHLDAMLARHRTGEPLQYVLGRWSFRHLDLAVDRRALIPRPETELVAGVAIELARAFDRHVTVADLGTGTGAIGLSVAAELPPGTATVWLTDANADALDLARANLAGLGRAGAVVRIAHGEWFDALPPAERLDVVVSNPPYVADDSPLDASVLDWEPASALFAGPDGLDDIRRLVAGAPTRLHPGGWLVLEIGADQGPAVRELLSSAGYVDVEIRPDLAGRDRIAIARTVAGSRRIEPANR